MYPAWSLYKQEVVTPMWNWIFRYLVLGPLIRHRVHATVIGRENLPRSGPYILAMGSHKTELESAVVSSWLRERTLHFYAKAEYWQKGRVLRWFMNTIGQIPVERGDARKALAAISDGADLLRRGGVLAVYPEGTRSPDDRLHGAYPGTVRTLIEAGGDMPIVPVGLIGMEAVSPTGGGLWPNRASVTVVIGKPIYLTPKERWALAHGKKLAVGVVTQRASREMMRAIAGLCGKEYVDKRLPIPTH